jgi:hypothetical protein
MNMLDVWTNPSVGQFKILEVSAHLKLTQGVKVQLDFSDRKK